MSETAHDPTTVRRHFDRVTSQGPTRLQTCSFLAGLTFAAFAAILAGKQVPFAGAWPTSGQLVVDTLLGATTITLLLATMGTYTAMHDLAEVAAPEADMPDADAWRTIEDCYGLYHRAGNLLIGAVWGIMLSLLILGFYVSVPVGVAGLVVLGIALRYLGLSSRMVDVGRAWWRKWRGSRGSAPARDGPS